MAKSEGPNKAITAIREIVNKAEKSTDVGESSASPSLDGILGDPEILALDRLRYKLIVRGEERECRGQNFDVLLYFFQNQDRTILHDEFDRDILHSEKKHEKFQDRGRVTSIINRIRAMIEPDPKTPRYLKTVHGRGYLFTLKS